MTKYQQIFSEMLEGNKELFEDFKKIHAAYAKEQLNNQQQFDSLGKQVTEIIHDYEKRLVSKSENTGYSKFSTNLSEKLWAEIRKHYPLIDFVGTRISR